MNPEIRQALLDGEQLGMRYALQVPRATLSGLTGTQLGRRSGTSIDFQDYREYQPGDDVRFIDWAVYARSDRLSVRLFREEVTPHLDLIVDGSRSMNLEETPKGAATAKLTAALATAATNAQCSRAVWVSAEGFQRIPDDIHPPSAWELLDLESKRTFDESMEILSPRLRRSGIRVLLSDLLWPGNPIQTVRRLSEGAAALFVVQLLAREDASPPSHGTMRLIDSESGELLELYIDSAIEKQYRDNFARHQQLWDNACRQCGAVLTTIVSEDLGETLRSLEEIQLLTPC